MLTSQYFVYLLASGRNGTLYTGVTNDLLRRIPEHKLGTTRGFTARYNVTRLVWYEPPADIVRAIAREKQIKGWQRAWKIALFVDTNPDWSDLYPAIAPLN